MIDIEYKGSDPNFVAAMANEFAQAYIAVNIELRAAPAREYTGFFTGQTLSARERLEAAQKALTDFQQANGITSSDDRLDYETAKLNEISSQLTALQAQTTDSQSKRQRSGSDTVAEVMQSPLINGLKSDIARLEAKLDESGINLGRNHPQILSMETELNTLKAQLAAETRKVTSSIETTYQIGRQREAQLQGSMAAQKQRVLALNKQRDQIDVLRREIESAQRMFDSVGLRASQSSLESQNNQTNIAVLNPAVAPLEPSSPRVRLNLLIAVFAGSLLGTALALAFELANRRIRSEQDFTQFPGLPLLGSIGSARSSLRLAGAGARA